MSRVIISMSLLCVLTLVGCSSNGKGWFRNRATGYLHATEGASLQMPKSVGSIKKSKRYAIPRAQGALPEDSVEFAPPGF